MNIERKPAVIFDRDGTLASVKHSAPSGPGDKEGWRNFNASLTFDAPVPAVCSLLWSLDSNITKIMTTGRMRGSSPGDNSNYIRLRDWLLKHQLYFDLLLMRPAGDTRKDTIVKREMYEQAIKPHYDVKLAVDDRPQVCDLWEELGIPTLRVVDPGIDPPITKQKAKGGIINVNMHYQSHTRNCGDMIQQAFEDGALYYKRRYGR